MLSMGHPRDGHFNTNGRIQRDMSYEDNRFSMVLYALLRVSQQNLTPEST